MTPCLNLSIRLISPLAAEKASRMNVAARRERLADRADAPVQYIEARHLQVERQAERIVEEALLQQGLGLEAFRYKEG